MFVQLLMVLYWIPSYGLSKYTGYGQKKSIQTQCSVHGHPVSMLFTPSFPSSFWGVFFPYMLAFRKRRCNRLSLSLSLSLTPSLTFVLQPIWSTCDHETQPRSNIRCRIYSQIWREKIGVDIERKEVMSLVSLIQMGEERERERKYFLSLSDWFYGGQ